MSIDEMQKEEDQEEKSFDEEEEYDRCSCCGLPFDLCSWGQCDQYGQMDYNNYNVIRPIQDDNGYSDSDNEYEF